MGRFVTYMACLLAFLGAASCIENDYTKLSTRLVWSPNLSVPLGKSYYDAGNIPPDELPAAGALPASIVVSDTIDFDFAELFIYTETIHYLMFRSYVENGFPADLRVQTYFMNFSGVVDSLFKEGPVQVGKASIATDGSLIQATVFNQETYMEGEEVDMLENIKKIMTRVELTNLDPNFSPDEFLNDYFARVEMGLQASIEKVNK